MFPFRATWLIAVVLVSMGCDGSADTDRRVERLVHLLGSENFDERERAAKELVEIGAPALKSLRKAATNSDAEIARLAKDCIPEIEHNEIVSRLAGKLAAPNAGERRQAAENLINLGPRAVKAVPALIKALDDPDSDVRMRVIAALAEIGPAASSAVPKLIRIMEDKEVYEEIRFMAAVRIHDLGRSAEQAVPVLVSILLTDTTKLKEASAISLGELGAKDERVVPALIKTLDEDDCHVRSAVIHALGQLHQQPDAVIPHFVRLLTKARGDSSNPDNRHIKRYILRSLCEFGPIAQPALGVLLDIVKDEKEPLETRFDTIETISKIGPGARKELLTLKDMLGNDKYSIVLEKAIDRALGAIR